ncbi:thermonuclease family protein [Sphingobacterium wenxiniae]|uniref:Endonuclease YncB, thermonuclease family n=1 Tax=Sphingobacterium wenxiniae TaxID=683125 RepID=A0A1I6Q9K7_9SPHI|nr:thermonuclease family protein [Sphingobacterium wenxiniae]SFS49173.1 Endonuclease YncB, thermonuclease family [Sphingobacterium wenxiniae]
MIKYFLTYILSTAVSIGCLSQTIKGKVIRIADGDTITLLDSTNNKIRIRLYGIDCPENGQDFSNVAKKFTSEMCFQKHVCVDVKDIDRYGRTVGIVWSDSTNVNLELLREGLAWHYKHFDKSEEFAQAEHLARVYKKGLWVQGNAKPPWEYRRVRR